MTSFVVDSRSILKSILLSVTTANNSEDAELLVSFSRDGVVVSCSDREHEHTSSISTPYLVPQGEEMEELHFKCSAQKLRDSLLGSIGGVFDGEIHFTLEPDDLRGVLVEKTRGFQALNNSVSVQVPVTPIAYARHKHVTGDTIDSHVEPKIWQALATFATDSGIVSVDVEQEIAFALNKEGDILQTSFSSPLPKKQALVLSNSSPTFTISGKAARVVSEALNCEWAAACEEPGQDNKNVLELNFGPSRKKEQILAEWNEFALMAGEKGEVHFNVGKREAAIRKNDGTEIVLPSLFLEERAAQGIKGKKDRFFVCANTLKTIAAQANGKKDVEAFIDSFKRNRFDGVLPVVSFASEKGRGSIRIGGLVCNIPAVKSKEAKDALKRITSTRITVEKSEMLVVQADALREAMEFVLVRERQLSLGGVHECADVTLATGEDGVARLIFTRPAEKKGEEAEYQEIEFGKKNVLSVSISAIDLFKTLEAFSRDAKYFLDSSDDGLQLSSSKMTAWITPKELIKDKNQLYASKAIYEHTLDQAWRYVFDSKENQIQGIIGEDTARGELHKMDIEEPTPFFRGSRYETDYSWKNVGLFREDVKRLNNKRAMDPETGHPLSLEFDPEFLRVLKEGSEEEVREARDALAVSYLPLAISLATKSTLTRLEISERISTLSQFVVQQSRAWMPEGGASMHYLITTYADYKLQAATARHSRQIFYSPERKDAQDVSRVCHEFLRSHNSKAPAKEDIKPALLSLLEVETAGMDHKKMSPLQKAYVSGDMEEVDALIGDLLVAFYSSFAPSIDSVYSYQRKKGQRKNEIAYPAHSGEPDTRFHEKKEVLSRMLHLLSSDQAKSLTSELSLTGFPVSETERALLSGVSIDQVKIKLREAIEKTDAVINPHVLKKITHLAA